MVQNRKKIREFKKTMFGFQKLDRKLKLKGGLMMRFYNYIFPKRKQEMHKSQLYMTAGAQILNTMEKKKD